MDLRLPMVCTIPQSLHLSSYAPRHPDVRSIRYVPMLTNSTGKPDEDFSLTIAKRGEEGVPVAEFFDVEEPELESWNFTWYVQLYS